MQPSPSVFAVRWGRRPRKVAAEVEEVLCVNVVSSERNAVWQWYPEQTYCVFSLKDKLCQLTMSNIEQEGWKSRDDRPGPGFQKKEGGAPRMFAKEDKPKVSSPPPTF